MGVPLKQELINGLPEQDPAEYIQDIAYAVLKIVIFIKQHHYKSLAYDYYQDAEKQQ